jgi:hypothetical protein
MRALPIQGLGNEWTVLGAPDADEMRPSRARDPEILGEDGRLRIGVLPPAPHEPIQRRLHKLLERDKDRNRIAWQAKDKRPAMRSNEERHAGFDVHLPEKLLNATALRCVSDTVLVAD